nr:MAG TPA: hypothetical protein [Caudoviricetes sp.]
MSNLYDFYTLVHKALRSSQQFEEIHCNIAVTTGYLSFPL